MHVLVKIRPMNPREKAEGFQGFLGPDRFEKLIPLSERQDEASPPRDNYQEAEEMPVHAIRPPSP